MIDEGQATFVYSLCTHGYKHQVQGQLWDTNDILCYIKMLFVVHTNRLIKVIFD